MNKLVISFLITILLASCNSKINKSENMEDQNNQPDKSNSSVDTIPKVVGVGGIFFTQTIQKNRMSGILKI